jgi:Flp pilus assembly pilin Flp
MATRLKERDVMNLKNLVYYLRAKLGQNESGQDLLEYALLVALIALVSVGVITSTGSGVQSIFTDISAELSKANP